jgi:hypothetical protein
MTSSEPLSSAWEPLTPRGVAAFAHAPVGRLWLVQFIVALLNAAAVIWFLYDGWFPTIHSAIRRLPEAGQIRSGKLNWQGEARVFLAEGPFIAFNVDLKHAADYRSTAHVQIEFGNDDFYVYSLLGYAVGRYPAGWVIAFNRDELQPWWGAWEPAILAIAGAVVVILLMLIWQVLATLYVLPVWLAGFFANRALDPRSSWRLAGAALMPGALLMAVAILAYDFGVFDLVRLASVMAGHVLIGWIYLVISPLFLPRHPATPAAVANPFARSAKSAGSKTGVQPDSPVTVERTPEPRPPPAGS